MSKFVSLVVAIAVLLCIPLSACAQYSVVRVQAFNNEPWSSIAIWNGTASAYIGPDSVKPIQLDFGLSASAMYNVLTGASSSGNATVMGNVQWVFQYNGATPAPIEVYVMQTSTVSLYAEGTPRGAASAYISKDPNYLYESISYGPPNYWASWGPNTAQSTSKLAMDSTWQLVAPNVWQIYGTYGMNVSGLATAYGGKCASTVSEDVTVIPYTLNGQLLNL